MGPSSEVGNGSQEKGADSDDDLSLVEVVDWRMVGPANTPHLDEAVVEMLGQTDRQ